MRHLLLLAVITAPILAKPKVVLSDKEWKSRLTPAQYQVLRQSATEPPGTGSYDNHFEAGNYHCAGCDALLFHSKTKFNSGCGWPAFFAVAAKDNVELLHDSSHGMERVEVRCSNCGGHLGHVFDDGPKPTGRRFCINSLSLIFKPDKKKP